MKIGIDVGTSVTKAVLFDDTMTLRAIRSVRTEMQSPVPGRYEYDLDQLASSVLALLRDLSSDDVELVAITGHGDGLCLTAENGRPVAPAISWLDSRGAELCTQWAGSGAMDKVFALTGNAPFPGAGAALLASIEAASPELLDMAHTASQCQSALFERLTGVRAATRSCAMLPVFDPARGDYSAEALELYGIRHRSGLLPPIADSPAIAAPILDPVAGAAGIARRTLVAVGPYDLPASALGAGLFDVGDGLLTLGTTLACQVLVEHVPTSGEASGLTLVTGDDRGYLRAMPAMVGTACLDWILRLVGAQHSDLDALVLASPAGAHGVRALPYLSPAGERAPFIDPAARAELTGLSLETTAEDVVRALCESLAYAARHCFEAAELTGSVAVCGGGASSAILVQIFADVLGRPVSIESGEVGALGAVRSVEPSASAGSSRPSSWVEPDAATRTAYDDGYAEYLERLDSVRASGWWSRASAHRPSHHDGQHCSNPSDPSAPVKE